VTIKAFYDGQVLVPEEPLDLEPKQQLLLTIEAQASVPHGAATSPVKWLFENSVTEDIFPHDLSYQHDHYLYGTPKRDEP
jgi:hypothetical protein